MPSVKLVSNDGKEFEVDVELANMSRTIKTMLEDLGLNEGEVIPLSNIESGILSLVIEWAEHHRNDPPRVEVKEKTEHKISDWDRQFFQGLTQKELFELLVIANYLDIDGLMDDSCKFIAEQIKGKTPQEIRDKFGPPAEVPEPAEAENAVAVAENSEDDEMAQPAPRRSKRSSRGRVPVRFQTGAPN